MSYLELYNERIFDLLGEKTGATKDWTDAGAREVILKFDELNILTGLAWRQVACTRRRSAPK